MVLNANGWIDAGADVGGDGGARRISANSCYWAY